MPVSFFKPAHVLKEAASPAEGALAAEVLAQAEQQCVIFVEKSHISRQGSWARLIQKIYELEHFRHFAWV